MSTESMHPSRPGGPGSAEPSSSDETTRALLNQHGQEETPDFTGKQQRFVGNESLIDMNATQAAIRAGYSKRIAYSIGSENLKLPSIMEALRKEQLALSNRTGISQQPIIWNAKIGFADIRELRAVGPDHRCVGRRWQCDRRFTGFALESEQ